MTENENDHIENNTKNGKDKYKITKLLTAFNIVTISVLLYLTSNNYSLPDTNILIAFFAIVNGAILITTGKIKELNFFGFHIRSLENKIEEQKQEIQGLRNFMYASSVANARSSSQSTSQNHTDLRLYLNPNQIDVLQQTRLPPRENFSTEFQQNLAAPLKQFDKINKSLILNEFGKQLELDERIIEARMNFYAGEYSKSIELYNEVLFENENNIIALLDKGITLRQVGELFDSLEIHKKAFDVCKRVAMPYELSLILNELGLTMKHIGNLTDALELFKKSLEINTEIIYSKRYQHKNKELREATSRNLFNIGNTCRHLGRYYESILHHKLAIKYNEKDSDETRIAMNYNSLAIAYREAGNYDEAISLLQRSLTIHERLSIKFGIARNHNNLALCFMDRNDENDLEIAENHLDIARQIYDSHKNGTGIEFNVGSSKNYNVYGLVYRKKGDKERIRGNCKEAKYYYHKSIKYHLNALLENKQLNVSIGVARNYNNIGLSYMNWSEV